MAVTRFSRVGESKTSKNYQTGAVEVRERYIAHLDNRREPRKQILIEHPELGRFQPHEDERAARLISLEINQRTHSLIFDIDARWSTEISTPTNPLDEPARIRVESIEQTVPFVLDHEGKPNVNAAGDPIEAEDEDAMIVFRITKKIPPSYPSWLLNYPQSLNSDIVSFRGLRLKPHTLKIARLSIGEEQEEEETPFLPLSMEIVHNPQTWLKFFANRGLREIHLVKKPVGDGKFIYVKQVTPILDEQKKPISTPQFLDEEGRRPRVNNKGEIVTLEKELKALQDGTILDTKIKEPLDPEDIVVLKRTRKKPRPFNGVLPLT